MFVLGGFVAEDPFYFALTHIEHNQILNSSPYDVGLIVLLPQILYLGDRFVVFLYLYNLGVVVQLDFKHPYIEVGEHDQIVKGVATDPQSLLEVLTLSHIGCLPIHVLIVVG